MALAYFDKFNQMDFDTKIECGYVDSKKTKVGVSIKGDMEVHYSKFFTQSIALLFQQEKGVKEVFLDFKGVRYVSSSFIAALLQMIQQAKMQGIELYFANLMEHMEEVIDSLGMGHFVKDIDMSKKRSVEIVCYHCKKKIKVTALGKLNCPSCGTLLQVSKKGVEKV
ncbi:MAG: STAS domain-containing protein [Spirochaetales bacterium]|nr:STAS domain-containing protein [Spirochaetales bacterium]